MPELNKWHALGLAIILDYGFSCPGSNRPGVFSRSSPAFALLLLHIPPLSPLLSLSHPSFSPWWEVSCGAEPPLSTQKHTEAISATRPRLSTKSHFRTFQWGRRRPWQASLYHACESLGIPKPLQNTPNQSSRLFAGGWLHFSKVPCIGNQCS